MINIDEEKLKELVFKGLKIKDISEQMIISISTVKRKMKDLNIKSNLYLIKNNTTKCNECNYYFNSLIADNRKFCSKSCSAKFNNKKKSRKIRVVV
jgi:predicted transcriptional regulator